MRRSEKVEAELHKIQTQFRDRCLEIYRWTTEPPSVRAAAYTEARKQSIDRIYSVMRPTRGKVTVE